LVLWKLKICSKILSLAKKRLAVKKNTSSQAPARPVSLLLNPFSSAQNGFKKSTKSICRTVWFYGNCKYALKYSQQPKNAWRTKNTSSQAAARPVSLLFSPVLSSGSF